MFIAIPDNAARGGYPPSEIYPCHARRHRVASIPILSCTTSPPPLSFFFVRLLARWLCLLSFSLFLPSPVAVSSRSPLPSPGYSSLPFSFTLHFGFAVSSRILLVFFRVNSICVTILLLLTPRPGHTRVIQSFVARLSTFVQSCTIS